MNELKSFQKLLPLIRCREYISGLFFYSSNIFDERRWVHEFFSDRFQMPERTDSSGIFFYNYIEGPRRIKSITEHFIDDFSRITRVINRRVTKSRSRAFSCLHYGTQRTARRAVSYCRAENDNRLYVTSTSKEKGGERRRKKEIVRMNGKGSIREISVIRHTHIHTPSFTHPPFSLFTHSFFIPTFLPQPTWSTGLRTACVQAHINKRSIHYL